MDAILELKSGVTGTVHLDYVQHPSRRNITLIGDRGTIDISANQASVSAQIRGEQYSRIYQSLEPRDSLIDRELEHFIGIITRDEQPIVTVQDGLRALRVADALIVSSETRSWRSMK